ncbi:MAG: glycosyltransferase [Patescibacteria group bacterium]
MNNSNIAFILFTLNEEKRIEYPVRNFIKYGEVLVLDGGSMDRTGEIAQKYGARFLQRPKMTMIGAGETTQMLDFALANTDKKWFFWQYVDDLAPKTLLDKLTEISRQDKYKQVIVPLYTYLWGKTKHPAIKTSVGCFFQRDSVDFSNNLIHGMGKFLGKKDEILRLPIRDEYAIRHFSLYNLTKFATNHLSYAEAEAGQKLASGQKYSVIKMVAAMFRYFWLFYKDNWKNGAVGFMEALAYSYFRLLTYFSLYEKENGVTLEKIEEQYVVEKKRIVDSLDANL